MSKATIELLADNNTLLSISGDFIYFGKSRLNDSDVRWENINGNQDILNIYTELLKTDVPFNDMPVRVMDKIDSVAMKFGLKKYEIKYSVRKDE